MRQTCLEMNRDPPFGEPIAAKGLLAENARLRRLCAEAKELTSRHEVALREGDHRIKNSLQIVASLMEVQERRETNPAVRGALHAAAARIQAVARMHDALQLNGSTDVVDLGALVQTMCVSLHAMAGDPSRVKVIVEVEAIEVPIALAQPMVLAVNELVVNALRHAFPGERRGTISVVLERIDGELRVVVADDGVGLPAGQARSSGFGMKLVQMMAAKIGANLRMESTNGARFILSAPYAGGGRLAAHAGLPPTWRY
jgi:two-component system, sensor histidine kinase PdtaS